MGLHGGENIEKLLATLETVIRYNSIKGGMYPWEGTGGLRINRFVPIYEIGSPPEYTICMND